MARGEYVRGAQSDVERVHWDKIIESRMSTSHNKKAQVSVLCENEGRWEGVHRCIERECGDGRPEEEGGW